LDERALAGAPRIERAAFERHFRAAVESSVAFAATMVRPSLPAARRFLIEPNASYDWQPLLEDQRLYPEDSLPDGERLGPLTFEQASGWMWRDGKVPEWVDVGVCGVDTHHTYTSLRCCGRFTGIAGRLYYRNGLPPFGIKSPVLPVGWKSVEESGRFDLPTIGFPQPREHPQESEDLP